LFVAHPQSEETRRKIREALRGKHRSLEHRQKQSETRRKLFAEGKLVPWNKDKKGLQKGLKGERNPAWKGGRYIEKNGYIMVKAWGHPNANRQGYVPEHRLAMSQMLGRPLLPFESVHHRNGIKTDNRPENLLLVVKGTHKGEVKCPFCHREFGVR